MMLSSPLKSVQSHSSRLYRAAYGLHQVHNRHTANTMLHLIPTWIIWLPFTARAISSFQTNYVCAEAYMKCCMVYIWHPKYTVRARDKINQFFLAMKVYILIIWKCASHSTSITRFLIDNLTRVVQKVKTVWLLKKLMKLKKIFHIVITNLKSFFCIFPTKIQALVSCDEFLYACIVEICRQSTEPVFDRLLHVCIATRARAVQKLLKV
jgi:hypothetical protein